MQERFLALLGAVLAGAALSSVVLAQEEANESSVPATRFSAGEEAAATGRPEEALEPEWLDVRISAEDYLESSGLSEAGAQELPSAKVEEKLIEFARTGAAESLTLPTRRIVAYDFELPTVTCTLLRHCTILLNGDEEIELTAMADRVRFDLDDTGTFGGRPVITVRPRNCEVSSLLTVGTSAGRLYSVMVASPPCEEKVWHLDGPSEVLEFYYPEDFVKHRRRAREVLEASQESSALKAAAEGPSFSAADLEFGYEVRGNRRARGASWYPELVFDDGARTFIRLASIREMPTLLELIGGEARVVNFLRDGDFLVVDRVMDEFVLALGDERGRRQAKVTVRRGA